MATLDQWRAIDQQYRSESPPDLRAAAVLVTAAICLILPRYFGQHQTFDDYPQLAAWMSIFPYPELHEHVYWALFKAINYGLIPWCCIHFVLRRPVREFGVQFVETRAAWLTYGAMLLVVMPFVAYASTTHAFLRVYPKAEGAAHSLTTLVIWELAYGFQFLMLECFFRGFLIFALARYIGSLAIFVMVVPYAMIHLGKPIAECFGSILAGIALGTIALRTGSIWGGVLVHCTVAWSMDLLALLRTGKLFGLFG
ncbi:MAG TPA: CPBP family intramembrane glutamic endopeptidase [Polyangiales bacterium]|nr:CPBP family intramembrane glutamic endopeptidase [Polyangiales bacterium]